MLRIKGNEPSAPPVEEPIEQEAQAPPPEEAPLVDESQDFSGQNRLDPSVVVYKTGDMGPFSCSTCFHFDGQGGCEIVAGEIDPEGICSVWTQGEQAEPEPELPMEPPVEGGEPPMDMPPPQA